MTLETKARELADKLVLDVCELPDRTSPEDWPEALLVTSEELHAMAMTAFETVARGARNTALEEAAFLVDNWRPQSRTIGQIQDDEQQACAIRALLSASAATPDPTRALARLFAAWWKNEQAAFKVFQTASLRCEDFLYAKLIEPDGMVRARLTDLGEAALCLAEDGR